MTSEKHRANAATAIALGMEAAADRGVPDNIILEELLRITMAIIASTEGGKEGLAKWLEAQAVAVREMPSASTLN